MLVTREPWLWTTGMLGIIINRARAGEDIIDNDDDEVHVVSGAYVMNIFKHITIL